jgi:hypothetical protein
MTAMVAPTTSGGRNVPPTIDNPSNRVERLLHSDLHRRLATHGLPFLHPRTCAASKSMQKMRASSLKCSPSHSHSCGLRFKSIPCTLPGRCVCGWPLAPTAWAQYGSVGAYESLHGTALPTACLGACNVCDACHRCDGKLRTAGIAMPPTVAVWCTSGCQLQAHSAKRPAAGAPSSRAAAFAWLMSIPARFHSSRDGALCTFWG